MRLITIAAALVATFLGASFASAQTASSPNVASKQQEPFDKGVMDKITATLHHKGITGVSNVRADGDGYQVSAMKGTQQVQVWVNPSSGQIRTQD